jgi:quercetin dioxygenase-like cupin family protein
MKISRRDLSLLLPAAMAASTGAQTKALPSKTYKYEDLPVKTNGKNRGLALMKGQTHSGYQIEMHETELGPGQAPHPPHHHVHEEAILVREGTVEVTIMGKSATLGPGSVAYVASGEEHGWKNVGDGPAKYFIVTLGDDKA